MHIVMSAEGGQLPASGPEPKPPRVGGLLGSHMCGIYRVYRGHSWIFVYIGFRTQYASRTDPAGSFISPRFRSVSAVFMSYLYKSKPTGVFL